MTAAARKTARWQQAANANAAETIPGAAISWRRIGDEKGRGVFATRDLKKGAVIEVSPVIPVSTKHFKHNGHAPDGYLFDWDPETPGAEHCMPLGYAMLYNHSSRPNMRMENDMEAMTITAFAARDIRAGEELTWNYNCPLWFDEA
jgi:uncharacterized protein